MVVIQHGVYTENAQKNVVEEYKQVLDHVPNHLQHTAEMLVMEQLDDHEHVTINLAQSMVVSLIGQNTMSVLKHVEVEPNHQLVHVVTPLQLMVETHVLECQLKFELAIHTHAQLMVNLDHGHHLKNVQKNAEVVYRNDTVNVTNLLPPTMAKPAVVTQCK